MIYIGILFFVQHIFATRLQIDIVVVEYWCVTSALMLRRTR